MMPPHPETVCDLQTLRYQELLGEAARVRLADEATRDKPTPSPIDRAYAVARHTLAWIAAAAPFRGPRLPASAWR